MKLQANEPPILNEPVTSNESVIWPAMVKAFSQKPFLTLVLVMAVAAVALFAATQSKDLYFKKVPVALEKPLETIPSKMGTWVQVSTDQPLPADVEETLGTKKYVFRDYVDTRLVDQQELDGVMAKDSAERTQAVRKIENRKPRAVMHLAVTYYTGMVDTVAHVPDRCYIADGYTPTDYKVINWTLGKGGTAPKVEVRFIAFEDATGDSSRQPKNVAYFFQVNGAMESSPVMVRMRLQNLMKADCYYSKVELMSLIPNRDDAAKIMTDFLTASYPEIKKCLPQPGHEKLLLPQSAGK